jgi:DNA-binding response OmpR family regulator
MVVDDDDLMLRYMDIALRRAGYHPVTVQDPDQVPDKLRETGPDLVLLDIRMPGTNGFDVFGRIREQANVPVIFVSASNRAADRQRALAIGGARYIEKPFHPATLLAAIETVLSDHADTSRDVA